MQGLTLFLVIIIFLVYLFIGGAVFHFIESSSEKGTNNTVFGAKEQILANHNITAGEFDALIKALQTAGVPLSGNQTSQSTWDLFSSIFFATTVTTTIGYGNISPSTTGGRVFCVFFACIGIPLFLVATANLAEKMKTIIFKFIDKGTKCEPAKSCEYVLKSLALLVSLLLFIFLPSLLFHLVETDWSYGEGLYYSFVTLTTIGFGDYVAGQDSAMPAGAVYRLFVAVWILFGHAWIAILIAYIQETFNKQFERVDEKASCKAQKNSKINPRVDNRDASLPAEKEFDEQVTEMDEHHTESAEGVVGS